MSVVSYPDRIPTAREAGIQTLRATRDRLFERGWHKGSYGQFNGPNCLVGAMVAISYGKSYSTAYETLEKILNSSITSFNDDPGTGFNDIVDVIDEAIKTLETRNSRTKERRNP